MSQVAAFYNSYTYPSIGKKGIYTYAKMKRNLFQKLNLDFSYFKGKRILEAGTGTGESTLIYHYFKPKEIVGIDIAENSIAKAKQLAGELNINARFLAMDLLEVGKLGKVFDFIMCEVLHQTPDPIAGLGALYNILKPNGLIVIAVAHKYGNLIDPIKRKFIEIFAKGDKDKVYHLAKKYFFNDFLRNKKVRGIQIKDYTNLDSLIADIYIHPQRKNICNNELLRWLKVYNLKFISSYPSIGFGNKEPTFISKIKGNFVLLFSDEYHISVLARKQV